MHFLSGDTFPLILIHRRLPDQEGLLQYASFDRQKAFESRALCNGRGTCRAHHDVVVETSKAECRCQMSGQSSLATACDHADGKKFLLVISWAILSLKV